MTFQKNIAGLKKRNNYKIILDKFLEKIRPNLKNNNFFYYQVDLKIFKFNIVIGKDSHYLEALTAFYNIRKIKYLDKNFTIFCIDDLFIKKYKSLISLEKFKTYKKDFQNLTKYKINLVDFSNQDNRLRYLNLKKNFGLLYVNNFKKLPKWNICAHFRLFIHILALKYKSIQLHGSSILYKKKGIVILGDGGAGKSTSTINAIQFYNANTVGDDYFLFCSKTLKVFPIYRTIKFKNKQSKTITFLKNYKSVSGEKGKNVYYCNTSKKKGVIINNFFINKIVILTKKKKVNFFDLIKSTMLQVPYWPDKTIKVLVSIFKKYEYQIVNIKYGKKLYLENLKKILSI
jgi:hypothetical protein